MFVLTADGNGIADISNKVGPLLEWQPATIGTTNTTDLTATLFLAIGVANDAAAASVHGSWVVLCGGQETIELARTNGEADRMVRQCLSGSSFLGLACFGGKFRGQPTVLNDGPLFDLLTGPHAMDQHASPWRFKKEHLDARLVVSQGVAVVELMIENYELTLHNERETVARLGQLIKQACNNFASYGADRSLPVLQVEGSLPLKLLLSTTPSFARVHVVPDRAKRGRNQRIKCRTLYETLHIAGVPAMEAWGFVVSNLGEILAVQGGRYTGVVANKRQR